jgi:Protein of unknown function (DUF3307)
MFETLILFFVLQIKHYVADFVIQTYAQTVRKGIYRDPVGISHSVDHTIGSLVALLIASFFVPMYMPFIILLCFIEGILHYHIDWTKVHFGCKDITKPLFWNQFGIDQLAHQFTYLAMVLLLLTYR